MKVANLSFWSPKQYALLLGFALLTMAPALGGCAPLSGAQQSPNREPYAADQGTPAVSASQVSAAEKEAVLKHLRTAEYVDRMNSTSWSDTNATLGTYYGIKARELRHVIDRLESGEPVSNEELARAMDNSQIRSLGGY